MKEQLNRSKVELKKARRQAIDAEINIKALLDANTQSILLLEKDGSVIHVNRTVADILNTTPEKLVGEKVFNYFSPELRDSRLKQFQKVIETGKPVKFQDERDGRTILQSQYPIFENNEVSRVAIYAEDITNIIEKEKELKKSRRLQSVLLQIISQPSQTGTLDDLMTSIHDIMFKELKAKNFFIALIDREQEKLNFTYCVDQEINNYPPVENLYSGSQTRISMLPILKNKIVRLTGDEIKASIANGQLDIVGRIPAIWIGVPLRIRNTPIGALVIHDYDDPEAFSDDDVRLFSACSEQIAHAIERKKFDTAIKESEELYRAFFEDNHSVMFIVDPETGKIEDATNAAAKFYGYAREELKTKTVYDLNQLPRKKVTSRMKKAGQTDSACFIFQHSLANGEIRDVEVFSGPFHFKGKTRIISIIHDITQRLKNEMELSKAKESAIQANKTKDEFLANISHEIRTPLNGVMGMLQVMSADDLKPEHQECINVALQSSRNLLRVLDDILDLSKVAVGTLELYEEPFCLKNLLAESVELFRLQADAKGIDLSYSISPEVEEYYLGDEGRMRQIIFNLMGNSIKFTDKGSVSIKVDAGFKPTEDKQNLSFTVTDTGVGIPENYLESVFESFTQVDGSLSRKYKGVGLGLSIVKRLVDLMGGSIKIKSAVGVGTAISFSLTFKISEPIEEDQNIVSEIQTSCSKLTVMLVEDEQVNRMMARKLLRRMGHNVICANNGAQCLEMLIDNHEIDAILMDIQMPVMDGLEATRTIRTSQNFIKVRNVPIIALSAHASKESRYSALAAGVNDYLCKPFEMTELKKILAGSVYSG
ncbi:ATP-binding protein [Maridesulfovibrio sp.]|uniref:ATP-binding protein n=1 Tax=Maridesulfovibrio sp. TaxID=2795000 RepID=UPI0029C9D376|nr:ATP-binding protein [Maridesulfovibrio sp.]